MSGKQARRRRQQVAAPPPVARKGARRRASPKVLVIAALAGLAIVGAVVGIALAVGGNSSSSAGTIPTLGSLTNALPEAAVVQREFAGIPQNGFVLGSPKAPVTMVEYIDLQCPGCRSFETSVLPSIVPSLVRSGKLKIEARPIAIIGPDSLPARNAAIAAASQNRAFNFMQIMYANQGHREHRLAEPGLHREGGSERPWNERAGGARRSELERDQESGRPDRRAGHCRQS